MIDPAKIVITEDAAFKRASLLSWHDAKYLFVGDFKTLINTAYACMCDEDWSSIYNVSLTVTYNKNNNKFCGWEIGGATNVSGSSLIIGLPNGDKPLAVAALRKHKLPNMTHAVVQLWEGSIVAITTHVKGNGVVLLYRVHDVGPATHTHISKLYDSVTSHKFVAKLQLCKVLDLITKKVTSFNTDLDFINNEHPIVQTSIRKASVFNCKQAMYIRFFYFITEGYKDWDIRNLYNENTSSIKTDYASVTSTLDRMLAISAQETVTSAKGDNVLIGLDPYTSGIDNSRGIYVKFVMIIRGVPTMCNTLCITEDIFNKYKDFFEWNSYNELIEASKIDDITNISICKYSSN